MDKVKVKGKKSEKLDISIKTKYRTLTQHNKVYQLQTELKKKAEIVDFDKEVLPNISDKHAYILKNYMCNYSDETMLEIATKFGSGGPCNISRTIDTIMKEIDNIIVGVKNRDEYIKSLGGKNAVEDLMLFLTEKEQEVFKKVILSPNPMAPSVYANKVGKDVNDVIATKRTIFTQIKYILERKKECEDFIRNNGGEDFLINEFGATLSEENFEFLLQIMMDYHYLNDRQYSLNVGKLYNYATTTRKQILKFLDDYRTRQKEVDELVESLGGTEKVLNELYLKFDDNRRAVFEERFLAYFPTPYEELAKKLGIKKVTVENHIKKINKAINKMLNENELNNQRKQD